MQQLRHDLVLHSAGAGKAHGAAVRTHGDLSRAAQGRLFRAALVQAHVVEHVAQRSELLRRARTLPCPQTVHPSLHAGVKFPVGPHRVEDTRSLLDEARQYLIDVGNRKRIVRPIAMDRAVGAGPRAVPGLAQCIAFAHEQQVFGLRTPGNQHRHGFGLRKSAQIVKMTVLPVGMLDVAVAMAYRGGG